MDTETIKLDAQTAIVRVAAARATTLTTAMLRKAAVKAGVSQEYITKFFVSPFGELIVGIVASILLTNETVQSLFNRLGISKETCEAAAIELRVSAEAEVLGWLFDFGMDMAGVNLDAIGKLTEAETTEKDKNTDD